VQVDLTRTKIRSLFKSCLRFYSSSSVFSSSALAAGSSSASVEPSANFAMTALVFSRSSSDGTALNDVVQRETLGLLGAKAEARAGSRMSTDVENFIVGDDRWDDDFGVRNVKI